MEAHFKPLMAHVLGNVLWVGRCALTASASHVATTSLRGGVSLCFWLHLLWLLVLVRQSLSALTAGRESLGVGQLELVGVQHWEKARTGLLREPG